MIRICGTSNVVIIQGARAAARPSRRLASHQPRRFDSHHAGSGESALHVAGGSGNESFGKGFYISLAVVPLSLVLYSVASSSDAPFLTGFIKAYRAREAELIQKNTLNQAAYEQASMDRHLFVTKNQDVGGPDLVYPECVVQQWLPWNVAAGHGSADLSHLVKHYEEKEKITEEKRLARIKDGKVTTVYDDTTSGRLPSFRTKKET